MPSFQASLPLSRYELDRDHLGRERPDLWSALAADPATRLLLVHEGEALLSGPDALALLEPTAVDVASLAADAAGPGIRERVYLGRSLAPSAPEPVGTPVVAIELTDRAAAPEGEWGSLRSLGTRLSDRDAGMLVESIAILNWHASHQHSPRTGHATVPEKGGWVRRDPVTDTEVFPRTDPAVIVGITDAQDRLLLASNALWESHRYSLLAGFVEPGESLEAAVVRESFEEAGVRVVDPQYLGSQPWPFPASLMVGFTARAADDFAGELIPDGTEILDARWFSRDELAASLADVLLPGRASIARAIIERWFGGPIDDGRP